MRPLRYGVLMALEVVFTAKIRFLDVTQCEVLEVQGHHGFLVKWWPAASSYNTRHINYDLARREPK